MNRNTTDTGVVVEQ